MVYVYVCVYIIYNEVYLYDRVSLRDIQGIGL